MAPRAADPGGRAPGAPARVRPPDLPRRPGRRRGALGRGRGHGRRRRRRSRRGRVRPPGRHARGGTSGSALRPRGAAPERRRDRRLRAQADRRGVAPRALRRAGRPSPGLRPGARPRRQDGQLHEQPARAPRGARAWRRRRGAAQRRGRGHRGHDQQRLRRRRLAARHALAGRRHPQGHHAHARPRALRPRRDPRGRVGPPPGRPPLGLRGLLLLLRARRDPGHAHRRPPRRPRRPGSRDHAGPCALRSGGRPRGGRGGAPAVHPPGVPRAARSRPARRLPRASR